MAMAPATVSSNPRTVEEIYKDFSNRRAGLVRALTSGNDRSLPPSVSPLRSETRADLTNALPLVALLVQMWTISAAPATQVSEISIDPRRALAPCVRRVVDPGGE